MNDIISAGQLIMAMTIGLGVVILLILKTKIHTFLALIIGAITIGLLSGLGTNDTIDAVLSGFGGIVGNIGIIIGFGVMMGEIFEISGAAQKMALVFLKIFGNKRQEIALALTGFIVSIPIFCDSGFVLLAPIAKALSQKTCKSIIGFGTALAAGLLITHTLVPPTPGPLAVAVAFDVDLGQFILLGLAISLPVTLLIMIYVKWLGLQIYQIPSEDGQGWSRIKKSLETQDSVSNSDEKLPNAFLAFMPILTPLFLILCRTVLISLKITDVFIAKTLIFLGTPVVAVGIALILAIYTLTKNLSRQDILSKMEKGISTAGIIILVTGGGGALGKVLQTSGIGDFCAIWISQMNIPVFFLPFLIATLLRFAQGSATVAMITAASITAPIVHAAGGNMLFSAMAACIGSFFFSYFNDSYFWVVNRIMGISETKEQIRVWSFTTTIIWALSFVILMIFYAVYLWLA